MPEHPSFSPPVTEQNHASHCISIVSLLYRCEISRLSYVAAPLVVELTSSIRDCRRGKYGGYMNVKQVIEQAAAWVEREGRHIPGFCGAHLMGSILSMAPDAPFPPY